jgi:hypothetical protein
VHSVALVVDREFGERLPALAERLHVWVVDSPANRAALAPIPDRDEYSLERGVTTFTDDVSRPPHELAAFRLADVDLHHDQRSHDPPLSRLEIYGTARTPSLTAALAALGFVTLEDIPGGFVATRPPPAPAPDADEATGGNPVDPQKSALRNP